MAGSITLTPDISLNTGISGWLGGISLGTDISGNNPNPATGSPQAIQTDAGIGITTDAGVPITTDT
jgi:hypothetical protein